MRSSGAGALCVALSVPALVAVACGGETTSPPDAGSSGVVLADPPPPPISGGTLSIMRDGTTAVAADPDRDRVFVVDLTSRTRLHDVALEPGDEPGRVVEDAQGHAHVALRGGGAVVTVDPASGKVLARRAACAAPRGLAFQAGFSGPAGAVDVVHVACANGSVVTLPAAGGDALRELYLDGDLRDVTIAGQTLVVSRFRSSEVLAVDPDGSVRQRLAPAALVSDAIFQPEVAWRMIPLSDGRVAVLHQRTRSSIDIKAATYTDGDCSGAVVHGTVSLFGPFDAGDAPPPVLGAYLASAVNAVDLAISPDAVRFAIVSAGTDTLLRLPVSFFDEGTGCGEPQYLNPSAFLESLPGQPIAVAFDGLGRVIVQLREPAALLTLGGLPPTVPSTTAPIPLSDESRKDTGHDLFHRVPRGSHGISCASCHVEGGDDGQSRDFVGIGKRRTQSLRGHILETAPFHWDGALKDMPSLIDDTMRFRMGGEPLSAEEQSALVRWIAAIPYVPPSAPDDPAAVSRGKALFEQKTLECVECHSGPKLTDNKNHDVGRGSVQVPSLRGLAERAPYMHDGCAQTIYERFAPACGGQAHGETGQLSPAQLDDLVAYLRSL